jgi:hypothetical protein
LVASAKVHQGNADMASWKLVLAALLTATPLAALAQDDVTRQIINDPSAPDVGGAKASLIDDAKAQGGKALRVAIPKKGANPWDSTVGGAIRKPIAKGDHLVLLFSARLEKGDGGATATTLPYNAIQLAGAPYSTIMQGSAEIGPEWKDFKIEGTSDGNYAANDLKVTIQLATAKQTVDFGPIVVLDTSK